MPRYIVERSFLDGLAVPGGRAGLDLCRAIVDGNADDGVTWVHSYVTNDRRTTFCVYDGPNPEAIRRAAAHNGLPIDRITQVSVLDPYFYTEAVDGPDADNAGVHGLSEHRGAM